MKRSRLRVLIVGPLPPPVGGVETMTAALLESENLEIFDRRHCDLTKGRAKDTAGKFDLGNFYWALIHFWRMLWALVRFHPDVVYMPLTATWSGFLRDAVLAFMAKLSGARVVGHVHGGWFDRILALRGWREWVVRFSLGQFDTLLMLGERWRKLITEYGYTGEIRVVPPTYRESLFAAASTFEREYEKESSHGLFVGHVGRGKGVLDLLEAVARLTSENGAPHVRIIGPPQFQGDWEAVLECQRRLRLEGRVELCGPLEGELLFDQYRQADYFVLPSYFEGLPIVILEAGLFGLPVISTPAGAVKDVIRHDENALLVQPGDVNGLAAAILKLHKEAATRRRLGLALKGDVRRFHPDIVTKAVANAIAGNCGCQRV